MSEKDKTFENQTFEDVLKENRVLVSIETVKIKDFIFSTNKLKLIRGASYLLDYMNQVEVPRILKKYGLEYKTHELVNKIYNIDDKEFLEKVDEEIDKTIDKRILYIGAGNAKFLVDNEKMAEKICKEIKEIYKNLAPSAKVVAEYYEMKENEEIWTAIDELAQKTAEKKSEGFPMLNIDLPFAVKCDLSGTEPAVVSWKNIKDDLENIEIHRSGYPWEKDDKKVIVKETLEFKNDTKKQKDNTVKAIENVIKEGKLNISEESAVKIKYSNKMIKDDENEIGFYSIIKKALVDKEKIEKLGIKGKINELSSKEISKWADIHLNTEIDDYSVGDSFIGFVYSDGDGLGDFLKNVKKVYTTEEEYLKFMRKFSVILDRNTKYVLKEVIKEMYEKDKFVKKKPILKDGKFVRTELAKADHDALNKNDTSRTMRQMLHTGRLVFPNVRGYDEDYYVGGKTGTAQTVKNGKYSFDETIGTYVGYGAKSLEETPDYVIMTKVWSDNRKLDGGMNAKPIFDEISKYMINYNKVRR